ncbi:hypothetical protein BDW59DRAFT_158677 [Aspergillus cavernicola]|uniref:Uncharacterized protein n=1 Tax=Aspergillus cavernicola TaxID=176166 RepID=A0ABR4IQG5_9EURO
MLCTHDPRLLNTIFAFKDVIRRMYNCQNIGMDILMLQLKHSSSEGEVEANILPQAWDDTLEIFRDEQNKNYSLHVVFEPVDDPETSIYESTEAPPEAQTFFDTQNMEVQLNASRIRRRALN